MAATVVEPTMRYHESGVLGAGPAIWYGASAVDGTARDWLRAPVGSIYTYKASTSAATTYVKTVNNGATADWVAVAGTANGSLIAGMGSTSSKHATSTANKNFLGYWCSTTATTAGSDTRLAYLRLYFDGATTGGGDTLRAYSTVNAACGTVHGAHISLNYGASGSLSGEGAAVRATHHLKAGTATGTLAALYGEFYLDSATSAPPASSHGLLRLGVAGDATNKATVKHLILVDGVQATAASSGVADMVTTGCADATSNTRLKINVNGTDYWLLASSAAPSA